jgi:hypothetical protein
VQDAPLLYLEPQFWQKHNVSMVNVTLPESCFTKTPLMAWMVNLANAYDTLMVNQLMYSLRSDGALQVSPMGSCQQLGRDQRLVAIACQNMHTNETWGWDGTQVPPAKGFSLQVIR